MRNRIASLMLLLAAPALAQVRGVTEAQLTGNARTFTARQTFQILGAPACATDPPSGACTTGDVCFDDTDSRIYLCVATAWRLQGQALAACATDPPSGACVEDQTCLDDTNRILYACDSLAWVKVSARLQDDATPKLSGALDLNGQLLTHTTYSETAAQFLPYTITTPYSYMTFKNGLAGTATGEGPLLSVDSTAPNVSLRISAKGSAGVVRFEKAINADQGINCTSCIDVSAETNLTVSAPATLTGDDISVASATTGALGAIQLAGDLAGTATVPTVAANAVALTTDTTGNYVGSVATTAPLSGGAAGSEGAALTLTVADATTGSTGVVQLAGDLAGTGTAPTVAPNAVALTTDTTGNYVGTVSTTAPLAGGAAGSEGTAISLTVDNATTLAVGVVQLAGDLSGTATAPTVAANSVALTTDTTGNYAAGDAEAGNATGLACSTCVDVSAETNLAVTAPATLTGDTVGVADATAGAVGVIQLAGDLTGTAASPAVAANSVALTTDTTGNYAAGDAEAGNATGLACSTCVDVSAETNLAVSAPITLTGDTVGFDSLGVCAPLGISFNPDESTDMHADLIERGGTGGTATQCVAAANCDHFTAPTGLTISHLGVKVGTAVASGSWTIKIQKSGVITVLQCTISSGTTCTDTSSAAITAGTDLWVRIERSAPTAASDMRVGFCVR